jgi:hypothetical protein
MMRLRDRFLKNEVYQMATCARWLHENLQVSDKGPIARATLRRRDGQKNEAT